MFDNRGVTNASLDAISDADLIRMHADGHTEALGVVCDRHGPRLTAVAARIAGQDATDAVQDGCLKAHISADRFRGDSAVTTWLHRIVTNAALDIVRRRPQVAELADEAWAGSHSAATDTKIDVRAQWSRLSREHQSVLMLVDMLDYPVAEAARILGLPENTVKSRASRARAALARKLEATYLGRTVREAPAA